MALKKFLVEIRLRDWKPDLKAGGRVIDYEEVELESFGDSAEELICARHMGYDQFVKRARYAPSLRKLLADNNLQPVSDICAPDAVEIAL